MAGAVPVAPRTPRMPPVAPRAAGLPPASPYVWLGWEASAASPQHHCSSAGNAVAPAATETRRTTQQCRVSTTAVGNYVQVTHGAFPGARQIPRFEKIHS